MHGETNNTGDVTLRANNTTTVVTNIKVHTNSDIFLTPKTANTASVNTPWISSIGGGTFTITHASDAAVDQDFAYAGRYDGEKERYEGLKLTGGGSVLIDSLSVLVKPDVAKEQQAAETGSTGSGDGTGADTSGGSTEPSDDAPKAVHRFFGTAEIDADRAGRDMGRIAEEILQHLTILPGSSVRVTVEIEAEIPDGVPDDVQRIVNENAQTLRLKAHGFETD